MPQHNNMKPNAQFYGIPFPALYSAIIVLAKALISNTCQLPINTTAIHAPPTDSLHKRQIHINPESLLSVF
jgi:hypothetical protein